MNGNQNYDTMNNHRICSCPYIWMQELFTCLWSINTLLCISVSTYISRWWVYITLCFYLGNSIALLYAIVCDMRLCIIGYSALCVKYRNSTSTKDINPTVNICTISYPYEQTIEFKIAFNDDNTATLHIIMTQNCFRFKILLFSSSNVSMTICVGHLNGINSILFFFISDAITL